MAGARALLAEEGRLKGGVRLARSLDKLAWEYPMNSRVGMLVAALSAMLMVPLAFAQTTLRPTPKPIVTADNEAWYQAGVPITVAGTTYYPTGPLVHFNGNEMVRSGHFQGIPLYSRTTLEPYSVVFVPLSGGLMQPYERKRSGEIADTVGSLTPSFPVVRSGEQSALEYVPGAGMVQAQAPPSMIGEIADREGVGAAEQAPVVTPPVGTSGSRVTPRGPLVTARRPHGLNGVFIELDSRRYFLDGPAVAFDEKLFTRAGEYHDFPVYRHPGQPDTVYIPPVGGTPTLVTPYRARE